VRFGLLGPLEVVDEDGVRRDPTAMRQRRLLLALLVWRGELVTTDRLGDIVWDGDVRPRDPVRTLRTYVARLRSTLGPDVVGRDHDGGHAHDEHVERERGCTTCGGRIVVGEDTGYRLELLDHELDVSEFERLLARARARGRTDPERALHDVDRALACWRGPALAEVADELWAAPEAVRLQELRLTARELRFRWLVDTGRADEAIGGLERHVREHPFRERPHGDLMRALALTGRAAEATQRYHAFKDRLAEEAGLDPSEELQRLHVRLLDDPVPDAREPDDHVPDGREHDVRTSDARIPSDLPTARTSFIGRAADLASLLERSRTTRLLTLTGIGGAGKTRLAIELAHQLVARFPDGVYLVELASLTDPELVARRIADAVGAPTMGHGDDDGQPLEAALVDHLRRRRSLLLVDCAEHLLDAVAGIVERLLDRCPRLSVLVTSREPLHLDGERVWPVGPLATTSADGSDPDALRLLVERTTERRPDFTVTTRNRAALQAICQELDGIPLALELASGRLTHLTPAEVLDLLSEHLPEGLVDDRRSERHRTLRATLDWSYGLLHDHERALLRDLSVFAGGTSLEAIEGTCRPPEQGHRVIDVLGSLVDKSLVEVETAGDRSRFRLLETVRRYAEDASEAAGERAVLRARHRDWHLDQLESFSWDHRVASPVAARAAAARIDDLRRALRTSCRGPEPAPLARQLRAMTALFCVSGYLTEGQRWHAWAVDVRGLGSLDAARLAIHRRFVDIWRSLGSADPYLRMEPELEEALAALAPGDPEAALARPLLGICSSLRDQDPVVLLSQAQLGVQQALAVEAFQLAGFSATLASGAHLIMGDPDAAVATLEEVTGQGGWDERHDGLRTRAHLAAARYLAGDQQGAIRDAELALQQLGDAWHHDALGTITLAKAAQGDVDGSHDLLLELLDGIETVRGRNLMQVFDVAIVAAGVALHEDDPQRACRLLGTVTWATNPTAIGVFHEYRRRLARQLDRDRRHAILASVRQLDPLQVLVEERERLERRRDRPRRTAGQLPSQ
jgi:predicted ATPase/DNA-binding SARP family transcriptional activator